MTEDKNEIITQKLGWFSCYREMSKKQLEYEILKLCNDAKVVFVEIIKSNHKDKNGKDVVNYEIVAEGTKQKLLLLKYILSTWLQGTRFTASCIISDNNK